MIWTIILPILGTHLLCSTTELFASDVPLQNLVLDKRGHIYIGGVNILYQLDTQFNVLNETITGPVQDHPACIPPQLDEYMGSTFCVIDGAVRQTRDNYNQLLLIDESEQNLITCGNVYQGTCEARPLSDITFALPQKSESFLPQSWVVPPNKNLKPVGFIAKTGDNYDSLYVASYLSPTIDMVTEEHRKPAIANRHLNKNEHAFSFYVDREVQQFYRQRSWHKKESVHATFIAGFSADNFAYFFFHQRDVKGVKETRVARICLSDEGNNNSPMQDSTYTSYIELPLVCSYDREMFPALSGLKLETVPDFYQGDEQVIVGTFSNQKNNSRSAICTFSFDEINRRLNNKVKSCSHGEGLKKIKAESKQESCVKSKASECKNVCTCNIPNDNYPLETDAVYSVDGTMSLVGTVHALDTNVVKQQIEVFLGVEDKNSQFSVMKFVLESPDRSHFINDYTSDSGDSKIVQLQVLSNEDAVLVLHEKSIRKLPISVCAHYVDAGCDKCLMVKDPRCGWCEMSGICTTEGRCTSDLWRTEGACTDVTDVIPNTQSMRKQSVNNQITIKTNYQYPVGTPLHCDFGKFGRKPAEVHTGGNITCKIPYINPEIEGKHVVDLTLVSVRDKGKEVKLATKEKGFTFFSCESYKTCTGCTGAAVGCGWCIYANSCSDMCYRLKQPQQCPVLTFSKLYIPADTPHTVQVTGVNLPTPLNDINKSYQCEVEVEGKITTMAGTFVNQSLVTCATKHTFKTSLSSGEVTASVKVLWKGQEIESLSERPQLNIYRCSVLGKDCSSCRSHSTIKQCGWCEEKSQCMLQYGGYEICPNSYSQVCVGLTIESFEPKHGPLEGGTLVTIKGSNLGSKPTDITSIKIAGLECEVQTAGFEVSRAVVCKTGSSQTTKHGLVEVTTSGDSYIFPKNMFNYKDYKVREFLPKCGIAAGGNTIDISGEELHIGSKVSVIVAGALCDIKNRPHFNQIQCTTRAGQIGTHSIQVNIDGGNKYTKDQYIVVPNPTTLRLTSTSSIQSGGILINVPFTTDSQLDCIQNMQIIFQTLSRQNGYGDCFKAGKFVFQCKTPELPTLTESDVSYVQAHLKADNLLIALDPFTIYSDPVIQPFNTTNEEGYLEWPLSETRELVLNGQNLSSVEGIEVYVAELKVDIKVTNDHIVLTPPKFSDLQQFRKTRDKKVKRDTDTSPEKRESKVDSEYVARVVVKLGDWDHEACQLYYTKVAGGGIPYVAIIIPIAGFIVLVVLLTYVGMKYHSSKRSHRKDLKTVRMHMEKLEMRVANECKEAFTSLQTHLTDLNGSVADIPFRPFSDFMANVLFPGTESDTRDMLAKLSAPMFKIVETPQVSQFKKLLMNKEFLQKFVEVVEADPHFDVANKCKMASLLVITISEDMKYLTEVLFILMERLIDKFLAKKNHPQLLLRRTESVADKLLTHWLNYCCFDYLTKHAGRSIFTLFSAIKQQLDLGPQDEITFEAKSSLNNEKMLRETIEFEIISGTVRDLDKKEQNVTLLTCDSVRQAKRKVLEAVHRNKPASHLPPLESFDLMYIRGNLPTTLREIDKAPIVEGWKKLNTLSDYKMEDNFMLQMVPLSTDSEHSSISPQADRRKASFLTSKRYRSKGNLINSGLSSDTEKEEPHQLYHLIKPSNNICETDTLLSNKMMSEVFLTRLLSTKGTLQPYVDELFNTVFMSRERVPPCIKYLFDFLERQAHRHNVGHNQNYIHTWKNNSLSLRFWMNVLKNPHFLLDIVQTPTIDSSLNIVCGVFMDSCSTSDKGLNKDSPINKLLYAKDIPRYKKQVQQHYEQVSKLPPPTTEFLHNLPNTGLNTTVAVSELFKIAQKYQKQLQTSFLTSSPLLNLEFSSITDPSILNTQNMV